MTRLIAALAIIAVTLCRGAGASDAVWRRLDVTFSVDANGALNISERADIAIAGALTRLERSYWADPEQSVTFNRIWRVDIDGKEIAVTRGSLDRADHFEVPYDGVIRWSARDKGASGADATVTYVIDSTVRGAVIPAWSVRHGRYIWSESAPLANVRERLRSWRESAQNVGHPSRYLFDYALVLPPAPPEGLDFSYRLEFDPRAWRAPVPIVEGHRQLMNGDLELPETFRLTHDIESIGPGVPAAVLLEEHRLRAAAMIALPAAGIAVWLLCVVFVIWRRGRGDDMIDDDWLRTHLFSEPPEVVRARWSGSTTPPSLESFLRRLEREHKVSIRLDQTIVHLRLLVSRESLSPYERPVIDALMPDGQEISSTEIQKRFEGLDFDPGDALWQTLTSVAGTKHSGASRLWQAFVFALFAGAMVLIARDALEARRAPIVFIGVLVFGAFMTAMWPDTLARIVVGLAPAGALILLVPLAIVIAAAALLHLTSEHPLSLHTTEGVTLAMLTVYIAIVVSAARQPLPDLQKARRYFASLLADNRTLRPEWVPYAAALGLPVEDLKRPDEDWADALIV